MWRVGRSLVWILLCTMLVAPNVAAQRPPGTVRPGQVERQVERPPEPTVREGTIAIPETVQTPPANAGDIRFQLTQMTVDGVSVYSADAVRKVYADALHREVTLAEIYQIVDALTARYRNDGYILSQVVVPAQSVEDGAIRLQAIEGYIADVRVEGGDAELRARVSKYGQKIRAIRPLTAAALERYVLLLNDLPGVQARAVLAPASTPGASDLVLQVSRRALDVGFSADSRGSLAQGHQRLFGDVDAHSLFGGASLTELRIVTTGDPELVYIGLAHDQWLGANGDKIGVAGSYVYSQPQELSFIPLDLTSNSETLTFTYSHPLVRSRSRNLYLRAALTAFNSTSTVFGVKDTADRVRALRLGLTYDAGDGLGGVNIADLEFSQGIPGLGASTDGDQYLSRPGGRADFRRAALYAARLQSLPASWSVLLGVNAQYAFTDLLSPELFSVGGEQFGRGYDFAELLNDHGAAVKLDLRYSHTWHRGSGLTPTLMPYGFVDAGQVWQRTPFPGLDPTQSAASAGFGSSLNLGGRVSSFVEFAKPLNRIVGQEHNRDARIYAGISIQ